MAKSYNLGSSSDMKRFTRDLEKSITNAAITQAHAMDFESTCPHCNAKVNVHSGLNFCPFCQNQINVELDIHF